MSHSPKNKSVLIPVFTAAILAIGILLGFKIRDLEKQKIRALSNHSSDFLDQIIKLIEFKYVDSVDINQVERQAVGSILQHLDPHSVYIPKKAFAHVEENLNGSFYGIGISYFIIDDTVFVSRVIKNGPAEKAGLKIGDQILQEGDSLITGNGITFQKVNRILKGPKNSEVNLEILRDGQLLNKKIERGNVALKSVPVAYMITPDVAFIKIKSFSSQTYNEFMNAASALKKDHKINKIILDLRNNSGGYLESAVHIADEFLGDEKEILAIRGAKYKTMDYRASKEGEFEDIPLAVLVNENTASASEALAGAIQDWDRGYIIGRQTFGKGLVQEQYNLSDGSALRLTVGRYYLPSGRLIQRPYKHRMKAYDEDILNRYIHGELTHPDSIHIQDTTPYFTRELDREVFAGDGIMPDIFVPIDTTQLSSRAEEIFKQHLLIKFSHLYLKNHPEIAHQDSLENFANHDLPADITEQFHTFLVKNNFAPASFHKEEISLIYFHLKALMASEIWGEDGYQSVINQNNPDVKKAISILNENLGLEKDSNH